MLTSLRMGGHLARVGAIVLGEHARCNAGPDGTTVEEVLTGGTRELGVPVLSGAPFGHGPTNHAFVLGRNAIVGRTRVTFQ
jgi:muramoyltetrapeptide carboxypeptidase